MGRMLVCARAVGLALLLLEAGGQGPGGGGSGGSGTDSENTTVQHVCRRRVNDCTTAQVTQCAESFVEANGVYYACVTIEIGSCIPSSRAMVGSCPAFVLCDEDPPSGCAGTDDGATDEELIDGWRNPCELTDPPSCYKGELSKDRGVSCCRDDPDGLVAAKAGSALYGYTCEEILASDTVAGDCSYDSYTLRSTMFGSVFFARKPWMRNTPIAALCPKQCGGPSGQACSRSGFRPFDMREKKAFVSDECCENSGFACEDGIPSACSPRCAAIVNKLFDGCADEISELDVTSTGLMDSLGLIRLHEMCAAAELCEPTEECDSTTSLDSVRVSPSSVTIQTSRPGEVSSGPFHVSTSEPLSFRVAGRPEWASVRGEGVAALTPGVLWDLWFDVPGTLDDFRHQARYPNSPDFTERILKSMAVVGGTPPRYVRDPRDPPHSMIADGAANFGQRLSGYFQAPATGTYEFVITSQSEGVLFLGCNGRDPFEVARAGPRPSWGVPREVQEYDDQPIQTSIPIRLHKYQQYYIMAVGKVAGGDLFHISVGVTLPNGEKLWPIPVSTTEHQFLTTSFVTPQTLEAGSFQGHINMNWLVASFAWYHDTMRTPEWFDTLSVDTSGTVHSGEVSLLLMTPAPAAGHRPRRSCAVHRIPISIQGMLSGPAPLIDDHGLTAHVPFDFNWEGSMPLTVEIPPDSGTPLLVYGLDLPPGLSIACEDELTGSLASSGYTCDALLGTLADVTYVGCYVGLANHAVTGEAGAAAPTYELGDLASPWFCAKFCQEYSFFALSASRCMCGNRYDSLGAAPEEECSIPCSTGSSFLCGGERRNSVYYETPDVPPKYVGVDLELGWEDARAYCQTNHKDLASIHSHIESTQVLAECAETSGNSCYIGLSDRGPPRTGGWTWSDSTPFDYENWDEGESNEHLGSDDQYVTIGTPGGFTGWSVARVATSTFVCEVETFLPGIISRIWSGIGGTTVDGMLANHRFQVEPPTYERVLTDLVEIPFEDYVDSDLNLDEMVSSALR